jgi:hypothetical protein
MQQIKLFKSVETELSGLESDINGWLKSSGGKIVNIFGNIAPQTRGEGGGGDRRFTPSDVFVAIVYEK